MAIRLSLNKLSDAANKLSSTGVGSMDRLTSGDHRFMFSDYTSIKDDDDDDGNGDDDDDDDDTINNEHIYTDGNNGNNDDNRTGPEVSMMSDSVPLISDEEHFRKLRDSAAARSVSLDESVATAETTATKSFATKAGSPTTGIIPAFGVTRNRATSSPTTNTPTSGNDSNTNGPEQNHVISGMKFLEVPLDPFYIAGPFCDRPGASRRGSMSNFFNDRHKAIDFVLAFRPSAGANYSQVADNGGVIQCNSATITKSTAHAAYRVAFERRLRATGLTLEYEAVQKSQDGRTSFVKIHAPWEVLARTAEINRVKMPIRTNDVPVEDDAGWFDRSVRRVLGGRNPFAIEPELDLLRKDPPYFTAAFSRDRQSQFLIEDKETFFTPAQRIRLVWDIILQTTIDTSAALAGKVEKGNEDDDVEQGEDKNPELLTQVSSGFKRGGSRLGIKWLLSEKVYVAAFPLHDGDAGPPKARCTSIRRRRSKKSLNPATDSETSAPTDKKSKMPSSPRKKRVNKRYRGAAHWAFRRWLFETWARTARWYKLQPLHHIRNYYGEKMAIYFAWLGFYTQMLIAPAIVGTLCFAYGLGSHSADTPHRDICESSALGNITVCRLCPKSVCPYKSLQSSCLYATLTYIFDNSATVVFALFVSIWAVVYLELWKRYQAKLAWEWDVVDMEFVEETIRPEYQAIVKTRRINPVTRLEEPYLPVRSRVNKIVASAASVGFMLFVVLGILAGIIFYRIVGSGLYYQIKDPMVQKISAPIMTSVTAAGINAICILIAGKLYERVAWSLTCNEVPRTETDFENSYTYKVFIFEFINYYAALFYIAFMKGKIFGPPTEKGYVDRCDPVGCLIDVCIQLAIIMIVKQIMNNIVEIGWPVFTNWWKRRHNVQESEDNKYTRWEKDFDLSPLPQLGLFDEYLEMIIQYGFVTMFVAAFPLAPLFALLNNIIEIRLDAYKITTQFRRPVPARAKDIGAWFTVLEIITKVAVVTNGLVIAFTSDFIDRMVYVVVYSKDGSLDGYIEHVFSYFNTGDWNEPKLAFDKSTGENITYCRYRDYRSSPNAKEPYARTATWWHVLVARLFFVLCFEHVVFLIQGIIQYLIPDVPESVQVKIQRENYLAKQALYKHEFDIVTQSAGNNNANVQNENEKQQKQTEKQGLKTEPSENHNTTNNPAADIRMRKNVANPASSLGTPSRQNNLTPSSVKQTEPHTPSIGQHRVKRIPTLRSKHPTSEQLTSEQEGEHTGNIVQCFQINSGGLKDGDTEGSYPSDDSATKLAASSEFHKSYGSIDQSHCNHSGNHANSRFDTCAKWSQSKPCVEEVYPQIDEVPSFSPMDPGSKTLVEDIKDNDSLLSYKEPTPHHNLKTLACKYANKLSKSVGRKIAHSSSLTTSLTSGSFKKYQHFKTPTTRNSENVALEIGRLDSVEPLPKPRDPILMRRSISQPVPNHYLTGNPRTQHEQVILAHSDVAALKTNIIPQKVSHIMNKNICQPETNVNAFHNPRYRTQELTTCSTLPTNHSHLSGKSGPLQPSLHGKSQDRNSQHLSQQTEPINVHGRCQQLPKEFSATEIPPPLNVNSDNSDISLHMSQILPGFDDNGSSQSSCLSSDQSKLQQNSIVLNPSTSVDPFFSESVAVKHDRFVKHTDLDNSNTRRKSNKSKQSNPSLLDPISKGHRSCSTLTLKKFTSSRVAGTDSPLSSASSETSTIGSTSISSLRTISSHVQQTNCNEYSLL